MVLSAFVDDDLKDTLVFKSSLWWSLVGLKLLATVSVPTGSLVVPSVDGDSLVSQFHIIPREGVEDPDSGHRVSQFHPL